MYALTARSMKYMDEYTMSKGIPSCVLMENASRGVVNEITARFPDTESRILVLCGPGNNGGDGICVARWLLHLGYKTTLYFVGDPNRTSDEFRRQASIITKLYPKFTIYGIGNSQESLYVLREDYDVIVDGIFGTGLNREIGANFIKFLEYINSKTGYKIAIDVPSGLNATTGQVLNAVFRADLTVTMGCYKTGLFFLDGRKVSGEVKVIDFGLAKRGFREVPDKLFICDKDFFLKTKDMALIPRSEVSHKGTYGSLGIIVSPGSMMGAAMLSARAAYRAGCGLVKIFCPNKFVGFFNVSIPEAVAVPYKNDDVIGALDEFTEGVDVVLAGPGMKEETTGKLILKELLAKEINLVLDAGALNLMACNLKPFRKRQCRCIITPHVGEMARLCGEDIRTIERNRIGFTKKFSELYRISMVVKSDVSLISTIKEDGRQKLYLNITGNSGLATAGSGDVLSGVIASLWAQGNSLNNSLLYGVMVHGLAADKFAVDEDSKRKMMAGDIVESIF
jgi:ADP-dependent NAD(P)H-hydrate dehydratase / NAD(P)H-hydrate epimerase